MPTFEAFTGFRYDPDAVRLGDVVAPPYDVIDPAQRRRLAERHAANAVHVELPAADRSKGLDPYQTAEGLLARWRAAGLVRPDPDPALYPYRMTSADGTSTAGVIGALGLTDPGGNGAGGNGAGETDPGEAHGYPDGGPSDVLPHEETLPKPRSDRLDLLRATRANLSPIWGLSMTAGLSDLLDLTPPPIAAAADDDGVRHELWRIHDPAATRRIAEAVAASPVVVADGHHRLETALAYRRERHEAGDGPGAHDLVMALVVELSERQLTVGAIHRTIAGLGAGVDLPGTFGEWFDLLHAGEASDRTVAALGDSTSTALVAGGEAYLLTPRPRARETTDGEFDSSIVAAALATIPGATVTHRHGWREVRDALRSGEAQAAVLLRPVTVAQIAEWASAGRRMPPKTTYFAPKPRTGMVFRLLEP